MLKLNKEQDLLQQIVKDNLKIKELQQSLELLSHTLLQQELLSDIGQEILNIINHLIIYIHDLFIFFVFFLINL
jgi:hypothetical protein